LLDGTPSSSTIGAFLIAHPAILLQAFGVLDLWFQPGEEGFDLCVNLHEPSIDTPRQLLVFLPPSDKPFQDRSPNPSLVHSVDALRRLAQGPKWSEGIVVIGRRNSLSEAESEQFREYNVPRSGVTVHTYDWLINLALHLDDWAVHAERNLAESKGSFTKYEGFTPPTKAASETG
jgi:hypothetical protein